MECIPLDFCWYLFISKASFLSFKSREVARMKKFLRNKIKTKWQCILIFLRKLLIYYFFCRITYSRSVLAEIVTVRELNPELSGCIEAKSE